MPPPTLAEVIFPEPANQNLSRILGDLKRANLSITNRLRSISQDAAFVDDIAAALRLPLVANERCGSWYIDPARKAGSAYFKSTDGHTGQWKFSTRRLNLHLLELIGRSGGCIIVDSTRRGKRMPDALSKTIPTWCAVLNRALYPPSPSSSLPSPSHSPSSTPSPSPPPPPSTTHASPHPVLPSPSSSPSEIEIQTLHTPPNTVSPSEHSQLTSLLPSFLTSFQSLQIDPSPLRAHLGNRPLRPVWITPADDLDACAASVEALRQAGWWPVVCCTASRWVGGVGLEVEVAGGLNKYAAGYGGDGYDAGGGYGYGYVQGAGDDTENWARGLTAGVFWRWRGRLLGAGEGEVEGVVEEVMRLDAEREREEVAMEGDGWDGDGECKGEVVKRVAKPGVFVGRLAVKERVLDKGDCVVALVPRATEQSGWVQGPAYMEVGLGKSGKAASRVLRDALPVICEFVARYLRRQAAAGGDGKVVVLCESGKDLSVGVALAVYCWCFDDAGNVRPEEEEVSFNKASIRVRLGHIVTALPDANPSRATLQSVNSFLMDWRK